MRSIPPTPRSPTGLIASAVLSGVGLILLAGIYLYIAYPLALAAIVITIGGSVALAAAGGVVVGLLIVYRRGADHRYIQAGHVTKLARAQRAIPDGVQNLSWHDSSRSQIVDQEEEETQLALPAPAAPTVPSFGELLDAGKVGPGRPLILSYDATTGQPIEGSWSKLYSTGIGGMTGSGKSVLASFLLAQSVASSKAKLIVIDPHAGDSESLSERISGLSAAYRCEVAQETSQIESALKLAATLLAQRIAGTPASEPLILVCDEWTSLLRGRLGELLTSVALDFAEQGRKYGCFGMFCAQAWQVDAAGPVRDRLASHFTLRTRPDQLRYQMGLRGAVPFDTVILKPGEAYFMGTSGDVQKVIVPMTTAADLVRVGTMIEEPALVTGQPFGFHRVTGQLTTVTPSATVRKHDGDIAATSANDVTTASGRARAASPEATRALALLHEGNDLPAIVKELRGVVPREGRRYMTALAEVTNLLREATK